MVDIVFDNNSDVVTVNGMTFKMNKQFATMHNIEKLVLELLNEIVTHNNDKTINVRVSRIDEDTHQTIEEY